MSTVCGLQKHSANQKNSTSCTCESAHIQKLSRHTIKTNHTQNQVMDFLRPQKQAKLTLPKSSSNLEENASFDIIFENARGAAATVTAKSCVRCGAGAGRCFAPDLELEDLAQPKQAGRSVSPVCTVKNYFPLNIRPITSF